MCQDASCPPPRHEESPATIRQIESATFPQFESRHNPDGSIHGADYPSDPESKDRPCSTTVGLSLALCRPRRDRVPILSRNHAEDYKGNREQNQDDHEICDEKLHRVLEQLVKSKTYIVVPRTPQVFSVFIFLGTSRL